MKRPYYSRSAECADLPAMIARTEADLIARLRREMEAAGEDTSDGTIGKVRFEQDLELLARGRVRVIVTAERGDR